jgi:hypothetical protein
VNLPELNGVRGWYAGGGHRKILLRVALAPLGGQRPRGAAV